MWEEDGFPQSCYEAGVDLLAEYPAEGAKTTWTAWMAFFLVLWPP